MQTFVKRPSKSATGAGTVLASLMEETQRLQIAQRVRELREQSPFSQQEMADKLGISLRAYQKLEHNGLQRWKRAEELGEIFEVDPGWIWHGQKDPIPTEDVEDLLHQILGRLDEIESRLRANAQRKPKASPRRRAGSS